MNNQDWEKFGADIKSSVQDAIESGDYSRLNQTVTDTVNGVVNGLGDAVREFTGQRSDDPYRSTRREFDYRTGTYRESGESAGTGQNGQTDPYRYRGTRTANKNNSGYQRAGGNYGYSASKSGGTKTFHYYGNQQNVQTADKQEKALPALYMQPVGRKVGGIVLSAVGYSTSVVCGGLGLILLLGMFTLSGAEMAAAGVGAAMMGVLTAIFGTSAGIGTSWLKSVRRFRSYIRELGGKEYCDIKALAKRMNKSTQYVVKDLQKMISRGWFKEGHLDENQTCLMVSHDAYQQYTALLEQMEQKEREEQEVKRKAEQMRKEEAEDSSDLPPQAREVLQSGDEYLRKIRACNDAIPGEEISAKISRIEMLVDRIFVRVKEQPDTVSDLNRMMQYYLPTTVKLLEAYQQLDSQPVQGENILNSKQEIEKTLDTLNIAFEKLLDSLFQDTAWDVASDISVLQTMLAQEGLTEDAFKKPNK